MIQRQDEPQNFVTPDWFMEKVRRVGPIALDPCATDGKHDTVKAKVSLREGGRPDYFGADWKRLAKGGLVFVNPEYSDMNPWMEKLVHEACRGVEVLGLLPSRTGPEWWHHYIVPTFTAMVLWDGRIRFFDPKTGKPTRYRDKRTRKMREGSGKFDNAVVYWGQRQGLFLREFGFDGQVVLPAPTRTLGWDGRRGWEDRASGHHER